MEGVNDFYFQGKAGNTNFHLHVIHFLQFFPFRQYVFPIKEHRACDASYMPMLCLRQR